MLDEELVEVHILGKLDLQSRDAVKGWLALYQKDPPLHQQVQLHTARQCQERCLTSCCLKPRPVPTLAPPEKVFQSSGLNNSSALPAAIVSKVA